MTVKIDFFISPAYRVPPISTMRCAEVEDDERARAGAVPRGVGLEVGRVEHREARAGSCASSAGTARMNMLRTNSACHAFGVMNRTGTRKAGSAPPNRSWT